MMSKIEKTHLLIIDLESTCEQVQDDGYHGQIIEIGAAWISAVGEVLDEFELLVQAENPISKFCTELLGITQADSDGGATFIDACKALAEFASRYPGQTSWGSWGKRDAEVLDRDCRYHGVTNPLDGWLHRNLKGEFPKQRRAVTGKKIGECGMSTALGIMGIPHDKTSHHRALPDALNVAKIFAAVQESTSNTDAEAANLLPPGAAMQPYQH